MQDQSADRRIIYWRAHGLVGRLGQMALVGVLALVAMQSAWALAWLAVAGSAALLDCWTFRQVERHPESRIWRWAGLSSLALCMTCFTAVGPLVLMRHALVNAAGAAFLMCATSLNNTLMTRGWKAANRVAIGSAAVMMVLGAPVAVKLFDYAMNLGDMAALLVATSSYLTFILVLTAMLNRESAALSGARSRWRMLFDHGPLPQSCLDASELFQHLTANLGPDETKLGETDLGVVARARLRSTADLLSKIKLSEANEAAAELLGVKPGELRMEHAGFDESFLEGFCASLSASPQSGVFAPIETRIQRDDGRVIDICVHIRTVDHPTRPWSICLATWLDISEARRSAEAQKQALQLAETANQAKSDFLATMSHEIRTPLNGVLGMVQAMERSALTEQQRGQLQVIGRSGEALLTILNDILDLSKIEAGKLQLEEIAFSLDELVLDVHRSFEAIAAGKGLSLALAIEEPARGFYLGDAVRVRQILSNLVSNAIKFTPRGGVSLHVARADRGVRFDVSDSGIGVAPERLERLFEKFTQADSTTTREFGGTGLGLAICRELCHALGGRISVESRVGQGSTFTAFLPLTRQAPALGLATPSPVEDHFDSSTRLRILAAEDNVMNQLVLKTLLEQVGLDPVMVGNGAEALHAWEDQDWDLILMDVQMPVMDGLTAAREIRRRERETGRRQTPILAVTANAMPHQLESYHDAGMNGVVSKPIQAASLFMTIVEAVDSDVAAAAPATTAIA